jgi:hypothetical protein
VAVETALMSMLLLTLMAGVVDTSMLFRDSLAVASSSRAGARTGSSEPMAPSFATDAAQQAANAMSDLDLSRVPKIWVFKADLATGAPASGWACSSDCVKFTVSAAGTLSSPSGSWTHRNACSGSSLDAVGVFVEYRHPSTLGFFFDNTQMQETAIMQLEPIPSSQPCVSA